MPPPRRTVGEVTVDRGLEGGREAHDVALERRELANESVVIVERLTRTA